MDIAQLGDIEIPVRIKVRPGAHVVHLPVCIVGGRVTGDASVGHGDVPTVVGVRALKDHFAPLLGRGKGIVPVPVPVREEGDRLDERDHRVPVLSFKAVRAEEQLSGPGALLTGETRILAAPLERSGVGDSPHRPVVHQIPSQSAVYGDIVILAARTAGTETGARGISLFVVPTDTPGFKVASKLEKHGWLSSDTAELVFEDMRIPAGNLLGEENHGFYAIMRGFEHERLMIGAFCAGEGARAIELTLDYVRTRKAFGKTLWEQQATRQKLADLASKVAAIRALTYQTAAAIDAGQSASRDTAMIKSLAPEILHDVVHGCLQLHGGTGYMRGTPIERMARDARLLRIGGGATEVMLEEVAKRL